MSYTAVNVNPLEINRGQATDGFASYSTVVSLLFLHGNPSTLPTTLYKLHITIIIIKTTSNINTIHFYMTV